MTFEEWARSEDGVPPGATLVYSDVRRAFDAGMRARDEELRAATAAASPGRTLVIEGVAVPWRKL